jgi:hypothetical protein
MQPRIHLPSMSDSSTPNNSRSRNSRFSTRGLRTLLALATTTSALLLYCYFVYPPVPPPPPPHVYKKADWTNVRKYEKNLPQHNLNLPLPEGRGGRYVRFTGQIRGLGWNNVLGEM